MVEKITAVVDEAYHFGVGLIFVGEYPVEQVAMNGQLQSEKRRSSKPS